MNTFNETLINISPDTNIPEEENWTDLITQYDFNIDFACEVIMMVESKGPAFYAVDAFTSSVKDAQEFKPFSTEDLKTLLSKPPDNVARTYVYSLYEKIRDHFSLRINDELTTEEKAFIIKLRIMLYREEYMYNRKYAEMLKNIMNEEIEMMRKVNAELEPPVPKKSKKKGKKSGKSDKSSKAKKSDKSEKSDKASKKSDKESKKSDKASKKSDKSSKGKRGKGKKTPEPPPPVKKTVSELHRDIISRLTYNKRQSLKQTLSLGENGFYQLQKESFIYFILYRMYDKDLITALAKINVYVSCLLEISSGDQFTRNDSFPYCNTCSEHDKELKGATYDFWLQWNKKYFQLNSVLPEKTFYLKYYANEPEEIVVEDMKKICFNIADFKREYSNYLKNILYFDIKPAAPIALKCLKTYNRMLRPIPNECISVPIILTCLLEETCQRTDPHYSPSDLKMKLYQCTTHACADTKMEELAREYENPTNVKQYVNPDPIMINYGNTVKYQYYNLPYEQELYDCVFDMMKTLQPIRKLYDIDRRPTSQTDMFRYHYYKWSKYMYDVSSSALKFCIYSYMFTRGGLHNIDQKTDVDQETMNKNLKYFMFNSLKSYNNTECNAQVEVYAPKVVTISDYNWAATSCQDISDEPCTIAERFDTISMVQMLQRVYNDFDHFDYKYFRPDDSILIRFHDNTDEFGVTMDSNEMIIPTLLCFRDFCTYLLPKCTKWFMEQERIYWEHEKEYDIYEDPNYVVNEYERTVYDPDNFEIEQYSVFDEFIQKMEDEANKYKKPKKDKKGGKKGKKDSAKSKKGDDKEKKGDKKSKKGDDKEKKGDKKSKKGDKKSKKSDDKDKKGKKGKKKGKEEPAPCKFPLPEIPDKPRQRFISTSIPTYLDREPNKHYEFEAYDLGPNPIFYKYKTIEFKSVDGIRVLINKNHFTLDQSNYNLKVSSHDHNVIFNMKLEECLVPSHPFAFHLNLPNGINMAFGPYVVRLVKKKTILDTVDSWLSVKKRLEKRRRAKSEADLRKIKSMSGEVEMEFEEQGEEDVTKVKSVASNPPTPDFRVISSPLHKFLYIKRVKSNLVLSENPDEKIIRYKPKLFIRKWQKKDKYIDKLFNRPNIHYDGELDWHATLPNGLSLEITPTVEASKAYVKQKYVANKPQVYDMKEHSRGYLSNGTVQKNMKDGSCVYYKPEMTITRIPYFKRKPKTSSFIVLPYYACVKDLTTYQVFLKRLCHKYQKKMVDIDNNYRKFKQSRSRRRLRRIYSLCENVHLRGGKYNPIDDFEVTTRTGNYYTIKNDKLLFVRRYLSRANFNYISKNSIIRREDGTTWRLTKDGKSTTQYPDNTRITTWLTVINENYHIPKTPDFNNSSDDNDFFCYNYSGESLRGCNITGRTKLGSGEDEGYEEYYKSIPNEMANEYSSFHFQPEDEYIGFEDFEPYVLIGLNYKFEHPCFAPVEYDYNDVITVTLPDEIKVIYTEPRNFLIESVNQVVMEISKNRVEYCAGSCQMCNSKTFCYWDIKPYMLDERIEKDHIFFYMKDSEGKNFEVNFDGNIRKYIEYDEDYCQRMCCKINKKKAQERLFVLQRDLTGIELSRPPTNYRFIDCLLNFDKKYLIDKKDDVTILTRHLYKTYSEHLMSIYPIPILLLECEADRIGRLWTLGDLGLYPTLQTRTPIFYIQRIIVDLPMEEIFDLLKQAVNNMSITTGHQKFGIKKTRGKPPVIPKPKEKRPKVIFHFECTELQYPCYWDVMPNLCSRLVYVCFNKAVDVVDQKLKKIEEYERSLIEAKEGECLCGGVDLVCT